MPPRPPAHLMLPSPLGLLEYDVLEDAVFLGPGRKGGLRASPTPFTGALIALKRGAEGYVARPLPGEDAPEINGEIVQERALLDGDRIRLGEQVALFRTSRGPLAAPTPEAPREESSPRLPRVERRSPPKRKNPTVAIITLTALALLLAATYRAVNHLKAIQSAKLSGSELPELQGYETAEATRAGRELAALNEEAVRRPKQFRELIQLFREFQRRHVGSKEAETAGERIRELMAASSQEARTALDGKVEKLMAAHQFARALQEVRTFEGKFGTTQAAEGLVGLRQRVRAEARTALDTLIAKVGPLILPQPREAHRLLISVSHEFPADMANEVVILIERCVGRMLETRPQDAPRRDAPKRDPKREPKKAGKQAPGAAPPGEVVPGKEVPPPARDDAKRDEQCRDAWKVARAHLLKADYPEALQAYTTVIQQYGNTGFFRAHKAKIAAGRLAARAGALGPQALVNVPVEVKKGRLELEYNFNDERVFQEDWTLEQPFSSAMPVQGRWKRGDITLEKATGLLHRLVFLSDVHLVASVTVHQPHDFGTFAVQESDDFRAILFNVGNTLFKLKKGDAKIDNRGHVLWYIGQGVWKDADKDANGFIKIAERSKVKLESGDKIQIELTRRKNSAEGAFQGKTDGVHLEGKVKGDDGSTMGPGRVGLFTNSGIIVVHSVRIAGSVDMEWFRKELAFMVAADPGPPDGN